MEEKLYSTVDIANELGVNRITVRQFILYCLSTGAYDVPDVPRQTHNRYLYTEEQKNVVVRAFKRKKHGEMADWNREHKWGQAYRDKLAKRKENEK